MISYIVLDDLLTIRFEGQITMENHQELKKQIMQIIETNQKYAGVIIDTTKIQLIDSVGLGLFFSLTQKLKNKNIKVGILAVANSHVHNILRLSKIDQIIPVEFTVEFLKQTARFNCFQHLDCYNCMCSMRLEEY